jgi:multiple sugar transport system substrate-binding protein
MTATYANASDGFEKAVSGQGTLTEALTTAQSSTIQTLKSLASPVKE